VEKGKSSMKENPERWHHIRTAVNDLYGIAMVCLLFALVTLFMSLLGWASK